MVPSPELSNARTDCGTRCGSFKGNRHVEPHQGLAAIGSRATRATHGCGGRRSGRCRRAHALAPRRRQARARRARRPGRGRLRAVQPPADAERRARRGRRAREPPHRRRERMARRQRAGASRACTSCASTRCATRPTGRSRSARADGAGAAAVGRRPVARRRPRRCATRSTRPSVRAMSKSLPDDIGGEIVEPAVQGVIYKTFARYTVREIFSTKRAEIQQAIETELDAKLARRRHRAARRADRARSTCPPTTGAAWTALLAEELATEKMRYTLELKDKQVKETELDGEADKVRREKAAEAAGREQIIAAKAQEEAMKHVLPFKQRQIEQRQLEAEAEKVVAHPRRRRQRAGAADRGRRRSRRAPEARRRRGLPPGARGQDQRRADGARRRADHAAPAADPEDAGRQALRQDPGHHRAAAGGRRLHRRRAARRMHGKKATTVMPRGGLDASLSARVARRARPPPACRRGVAVARAIVVQDQAALRAAPRDSAPQQALLWQGEVVEVRGERLDYLQVYDYRRERGGFVRASQVRRIDARRRRKRPSCSRSCASCATRRAPKRWASASPRPTCRRRRPRCSRRRWRRSARRARHASPTGWRGARRPASCARKAADAALVRASRGRGALRRQVHELSSATGACRSATTATRFAACWRCARQPEQRARAALALTRPECVDPHLPPAAAPRASTSGAPKCSSGRRRRRCPAISSNRVLMRRAAVWSSARLPARAQRRARGRGAAAARAGGAGRASIKAELTDDDARDLQRCRDARQRVALGGGAGSGRSGAEPRHLVTVRRAAPGETCLLLVDAKHDAPEPARETLHLRHRLGELRHAQSRRQRARAGGAADGHLARAVDVPQGRRRLDGQRAAAGRDDPGRRLRRVRRLGARRQADAGRARGAAATASTCAVSSCCASTRSPPSDRPPIRAPRRIPALAGRRRGSSRR